MEGQTAQINVEYFFRKLYDLLYGAHGAANYAALVAFLTSLWLWVTAIGYFIAVAGLFLIVYCTVRLFELRQREEHYYATVIKGPEPAQRANARWDHIQSLMASGEASKWREAIIEADIMLSDALYGRGYEGENVSEKLKSADPRTFRGLNDAWEAHKVRNQIAHEGSAFPLSEAIARRTIARFETALRELGAL